MRFFFFFVFVTALICMFGSPARAILTTNEDAIDLLGQFSSVSSDTTPNYKKGCMNNGASQIGFNWPTGSGAIDTANHRLFIPDASGNRVLVFTLTSGNALSSKTPANVIGQPDFSGCTCNGGSGNGTQSGLCTNNDPGAPQVAFDSVNNQLFVMDANDNRVLVFNTSTITNGMNASFVLGQSSFTGTGSGTTQSKLNASGNFRGGLALDTTGQLLFVADANNNRVMVFNVAPGTIANGENASYVLGQSGYTSATAATTQSGLNTPTGLALDPTNHLLYVVDEANNRVMVFNVATGAIASGENASFELGQPSGANAFTTSGTAVTQLGMNEPLTAAFDSVHTRLFVGDFTNNRVLVFNTASISNGMNAANVIGQSNFTSGTFTGFTTQSQMNAPSGEVYDPSNNLLYVSDIYNSRVMIFDVSSITNGENATDEIGQYTSLTSTATVTYTQAGQYNGATALGFGNDNRSCNSSAASIALDTVNHYLYVADAGNSRVLVYALNTDNSFPSGSGGHTASYVLGQSALDGVAPAVTQSRLNCPMGLAIDNTNQLLYVADEINNRIMVFNTSGLTTGENASFVLGKTTFTSSSSGTTQAKLNGPMQIALDTAGQLLYVADYNNNRVMVFNVAPGTLANGENASFELGQPSGASAFTTKTAATTQSGLSSPISVTLDTTYGRLFVADNGNNRIMVFPTSGISNGENATYVLGQSSFTAGGGVGGTTGTVSAASVAYDQYNNRLFVGAKSFPGQVEVFNVAPSVIATGMSYTYHLPSNSGVNQYMIGDQADCVFYDPGSSRLFVCDDFNNRVLIYEGTFQPLGEYFIP